VISVDYLAAGISRNKENNDIDQFDQIPVAHIIEKWHVTINDQYFGEFITHLFHN
jgi:hypothetical protein